MRGQAPLKNGAVLDSLFLVFIGGVQVFGKDQILD